MRKIATCVSLLLAASTLFAQTGATTSKTATKTAKTRRTTTTAARPATVSEIESLKEMIQQQQQATQAQLDALKQQLAQRDAQIQQLQQSIQQAQSTAQEARTKVSEAESAVQPLKGDVDDLKANTTNIALQIQEEQKKAAAPASDSINLAQGKLKIGAVAYADWGIYPSTGYGPAFLDTPHNYPGPGNDGYNAFNLNRAYVNILYSPTNWLTFRITPDIYRDINNAGGQKTAAATGNGSTPNGSLNLRLKYGYAEFSKMFSGAFKDDNIRFGQQTNPMIDWEESLYGYRFVSLVPWNFISLSSTYTGVSINGPIKGKNGKQYVEYQIGAFNNSNFHQYELAESKTVMARASFYPMGATSKYQGLGLTAFIDYGKNNTAPDSPPSFPVVRGSALMHYQSAHNGGQIAFEYMWGHNAFGTGNLFAGAAPLDIAGVSGAAASTVGTLAKAVLPSHGTRQQGFDFFGHVNIPRSKWALFGLYQFFQPNTNVTDDPLDFHRVVAGLSYTVNKNLRFAFDNQDVIYKRNATVPSSVLPDVKALFLNMEFSF